MAKSSSATPLLLHAVGAAAEKAGLVAHAASPASTQPEPCQPSPETRTPRTPGSGMPPPPPGP